MNEPSSPRRARVVWSAAVIGLSLILCTIILSDAVQQTRASSRAIRVKGFAERRIRSDMALWSVQVASRAATLPEAYAVLATNVARTAVFLNGKGLAPSAVSTSAVYTETRYRRDKDGNETSDVEAYVLRQSLSVESAEVGRIEALSKDVTQLVREGIELSSYAPSYYFTKLESLKIEMLGEATRDALRRARTLADSGGIRLGAMRSAQQGVFQITPVYSTEVSGYGVLDTSSVEKSIKAIVDAEFAVR